MSRRDDRDRDRERASRSQPQASARTNEYFVPKDGIDREVITADICRYLGNDALVRPGTYEVGTHQQNMLNIPDTQLIFCCRTRQPE